MSNEVLWVFPKVDAETLRACVEAQRAVDRRNFPEGKPEVAVAVAAEAALFREAGFLAWGPDEKELSPHPKTHPDGAPFEPGTVLSVAASTHSHIDAVTRPQCWYRVGPHPYAVDIQAHVWCHTWHPQWGWMQSGARFAPDQEVEKEPESPCAVCGGQMEYEITFDGVDLVICFECRRQYVAVTMLLDMEVGALSKVGWVPDALARLAWDRAALRKWCDRLTAAVNARRVGDGRPAASALPSTGWVCETRADAGAQRQMEA